MLREESEEEKMALTTQFWGVRGSVPSPGPDTAGVGGNTSCVALHCDGEYLILDGGTGLRQLGNKLLADMNGSVSASMLFSHVHWDHIQGIPFFTPLFMEQTRLALYGNPEEGTLRDALIKQMAPPTFPVAFDDIPAQLLFGDIKVGVDFNVGRFKVRAAPLNHPGGSLAFRVTRGGRSVVYATDTEHHADGQLDHNLVELARDADILIYDAQYTNAEYDGHVGPCRHGWGHSTWEEGVKVARAANVGRLVLYHHDPSHDDAKVAEIEAKAAAQLPGTIAAREGLSLVLDSHTRREAA